MSILDLPENGRLTPGMRGLLFGGGSLVAAVAWGAPLIDNGLLQTSILCVGSLWLLCSGLWFALAGLRWAVAHPSQKDFWPTMLGVVVGFFFATGAFGLLYRAFGVYEDCPASNSGCRVEDLASCIYFSFVTITTLGYGDIAPRGVTRFVAASEAVMGYVVLGVAVSLFNTLLAPKSDAMDATPAPLSENPSEAGEVRSRGKVLNPLLLVVGCLAASYLLRGPGRVRSGSRPDE